MTKRQERPLRYIVFQPTQFCNINCTYCYLPNREIRGLMTYEVLESVIKKILRSKYFVSNELTFLWHAGEPLVAGLKFYEKVVSLCEKHNIFSRNINHQIQTNATLIDDKWCTFFKKNNFHIGVSLDGPKFIHDQCRVTRNGAGTFDETMKGIHLLHSHGIVTGIISVLTRNSLSFVDDIYDFFFKENLHYIGFNIEEVEGYNKESSFSSGKLELITNEYKIFFKKLYERIKYDNYQLKVREFDKVSSILLGKKTGDGFIYKSLEASPFGLLTIGIDGNVYPFSPEFSGAKSKKYHNFSCGNLAELSFDKIRENILTSKLRADVDKSVSICESTCGYFSYCGGGFLSNKYSENGDIMKVKTRTCTLHSQSVIEQFLRSAREDSINTKTV